MNDNNRNLAVGILIGLIVAFAISYTIVKPMSYSESIGVLNTTGVVMISEGVLYYTPAVDDVREAKELKAMATLSDVYMIVIDQALDHDGGF